MKAELSVNGSSLSRTVIRHGESVLATASSSNMRTLADQWPEVGGSEDRDQGTAPNVFASGESFREQEVRVRGQEAAMTLIRSAREPVHLRISRQGLRARP